MCGRTPCSGRREWLADVLADEAGPGPGVCAVRPGPSRRVARSDHRYHHLPGCRAADRVVRLAGAASVRLKQLRQTPGTQPDRGHGAGTPSRAPRSATRRSHQEHPAPGPPLPVTLFTFLHAVLHTKTDYRRPGVTITTNR